MSNEALPKTYTTEQLAEILKVHVGTIRVQIRRGNIKAVKVCGHYLILEDEVDKLLKEGWKGPKKPEPGK